MTEHVELKQLTLVPLTDDERRRVAHSPIFGYIRARGMRIPFERWQEGMVLFISNNNDSIRRTIYRSAAKQGIVVTCETVDGRDAFYKNMGEVSSGKVAAPRPLTREWDPIMSVEQLRLVRARRQSPDGVERPVGFALRAGQRIRVYPWAALREGDFFVVPLERETGREERSLKNGFRDAANRFDYEIQVTKWNINLDGEAVPGLRVTMIQRGLADLKRKAAHRVGAVPVISKGRKVHVPKTRQATLIRAAVKACLRAGATREQIDVMFPDFDHEGKVYKLDTNFHEETLKAIEREENPPPKRDRMAERRAADARRDIEVAAREERNRLVREARDGARPVQENRETIASDPGAQAGMGAADEAEEPHEFVLGAGYELRSMEHLDVARDAAAQQSDVPVKRSPRAAESRDVAPPVSEEPVEPAVLGRQFHHGEMTEVAVVDYSSVVGEVDIDNPIHPQYNKAATIKRRLEALRGD